MTLRAGILGTGGIGLRHANALAEVDGVELVACCGRREAQAAEFAAPFGIPAYTDLARMLDGQLLDLVIVALPPFAHSGQVEQIAAAGVNMLVEKPIALDLDRATSMVEAARGVVAACGFVMRFGAAVERWQELEQAGVTGATGHFAGSFHCNQLHADWWRDRSLSGGQMVEQLIHIADLARLSLGMPQTVYARAGRMFHRHMDDYTDEDASAIVFGYDDGRVGVLHASNGAIPGRWMRNWQIVAERATGMFSGWNEGEIVRTAGAEPQSERVAGNVDIFVAQLTDLRDAIIERRPPRVPIADGLATLRIVLAARQSADERREIAL